MPITQGQQIDANSRTITSNEAFLLESTWTFAAATTGAVGAHTLFTVTGNVLVQVFAVCDTDLAGATATIEVGVAGNTARLLSQQTATDFDDGDVWTRDENLQVGAGSLFYSSSLINDGADIILTVATAAVSAGAVDFYCAWRPLSAGSSVTATTPA